MTGRVPVARRALFQDRRRAVLAVGGVAAALLLVLTLQGIFDGAISQTTAYLRGLPAGVIVSEHGVRTMHMSSSTLDPGTVGRVGRVPGVAWAEPIRFTTTFLVSDTGRQQLSYVIGYDTRTGRAGPSHLTSGRAPRHGEIAVERVAADRLHVGLGDTVIVLGARFGIAGIFRGGTTIANSTAFITTGDFAAQRGPAVAYVLAAAGSGVSDDTLAHRISAALPELSTQTRDGFVREEAALVTDMSADLMQIMALVAFAIAQAVIALTMYTLTLTKLREYAVVKALGARTARVAGTVVAQALYSIGLALAVATAAAVGLAALVGRLNPAITIVIEPGSVARVGLAAVVIGVLAAAVPVRRVATVDPATSFRRST